MALSQGSSEATPLQNLQLAGGYHGEATAVKLPGTAGIDRPAYRSTRLTGIRPCRL